MALVGERDTNQVGIRRGRHSQMTKYNRAHWDFGTRGANRTKDEERRQASEAAGGSLEEVEHWCLGVHVRLNVPQQRPRAAGVRCK
jgi:hypothetical protein